jgi:maleate isomerase
MDPLAHRFDRLRVGLLIPSTNAVMERDLWRMAPPDVTVVTARMAYDRRLAPLERLERQLDSLPRAIEDVLSAGVDVVLYGCTSGSFIHGRAWEQRFLKDLEARASCPVVLTARALTDAALAAGIRRAIVVTPYRREVNARLLAYLSEASIEVRELVVLNGSPPEAIRLDEIRRAVRGSRGDGADGFIVACTALRAWEAFEPVLPELGRPVVTSNQAALQAVLRLDPRGPGHA